ncbi:hypothetical protein, partial [Streptomyces longisporoflavus]|uniref:hypothetical protein n=1 Tax=Streptomyces longisporoflavus TaxID=28044 RepID=UPI001E383906
MCTAWVLALATGSIAAVLLLGRRVRPRQGCQSTRNSAYSEGSSTMTSLNIHTPLPALTSTA